MDDNVNKTNLVSAKSFRDELQQQILDKNFPILENNDNDEIIDKVKDTSIENETMNEVPTKNTKPTSKKPKNKKNILVSLLVAAGIASSAFLVKTGIKNYKDDKTYSDAVKQAEVVLDDYDYRIHNFEQLDPSIQDLFKVVVWNEAERTGKDPEQELRNFLTHNREIPSNYYDYDPRDPQVIVRFNECITNEIIKFRDEGISSNSKNEIVNMTNNGNLSDTLNEAVNSKPGRSL